MDMVGKRKELSPRFLDYRKIVSFTGRSRERWSRKTRKGKVFHFESEVNLKRLKTLLSVWLAMQARVQRSVLQSHCSEGWSGWGHPGKGGGGEWSRSVCWLVLCHFDTRYSHLRGGDLS